MVMVSHKHEFIFLKTRKTAGTSIEMALEPLCCPPGTKVAEKTKARITAEGIVGRRLTPRNRLKQVLRITDWHNHMPAEAVRAALGDDRWQRYRKIASVRNPFALAVSRFHWKETRADSDIVEDFATIKEDFRVWARANRLDCDRYILAIGDTLVTDTMIRFETLQADMDATYRLFDPAMQHVTIPHTKDNAKRRKYPVEDYYDAETTGLVLRGAAWVFDRFGYSDRPEDSRVPPTTGAGTDKKGKP